MNEPETCPQPYIFDDYDADNIVDSTWEDIEEQFEFHYWFLSNGEPLNAVSTFNSQTEFIDALLKSKEPMMIFCSSRYKADYKFSFWCRWD